MPSDRSQSPEGVNLLFGLSLDDFVASAWENESVGEDLPVLDPQQQPKTELSVHPRRQLYQSDTDVDGHEDDFRLAYACSGYCTPSGKVHRPPVRLVDVGARGIGMIAAHAIPRGQVLYTEKAAVATQTASSVRACQACFRSMETIDACCDSSNKHPLPHPELWPVVPDRHEECPDCGALFCSVYCQREFVASYDTCCGLARSISALDVILEPPIEAAVVLAVRTFWMELSQLRRIGTWKEEFFGLCGSSDDIRTLEIGVRIDTGYTLQPVYDMLVQETNLTPDEQTFLSLDHLQGLVAKAARNGVSLWTQSPFKSYYAALQRQASRGTEKYDNLISEVAQALGSPKLQRGMDQLVEERVAPHVAALFPLTARINHDCAPNAEIQSQVFVDAHLDLVATKDIAQGEEITITYVSGRNKQGRRKALWAHYLFHCECSTCSSTQEPPQPRHPS